MNLSRFSKFVFSLLMLVISNTGRTITLAEILGQDRHVKQLNSLTKSKESLNQTEILHLGKKSKPKRYEVLANAKEYIFISIPYWFQDNEGKSLYKHLQKVMLNNPKLDVKILTDFTSPVSTSDFFGRKMYAKLKRLVGKQNIVQWNKLWNLRRHSFKVHSSRLHDKMIIVDGKVMITGGMNIGNDYLYGGINDKGWHDTDILVKGYAVQDGAKIFLKTFLLQKHLDIYGSYFPFFKSEQVKVLQNLYYKDIAKTWYRTKVLSFIRLFDIGYDQYKNNSRYFPKLEVKSSSDSLRLIYDNPLVNYDYVWVQKKNKRVQYIRRTSKFINTIEYVQKHTRKSIKAIIPYLTLSRRMINFFKNAAKTVDVKIITNSLSSHDLGQLNFKASSVVIKELLKAGVKIYGWQGHTPIKKIEKDFNCKIKQYWPGHTIHTKLIIFDDEVSFLGSHNFNVRSEWFNTELMVMIRSVKKSQELANIFEYDLDLKSATKLGYRRLKCSQKYIKNRPRRVRPYKVKDILPFTGGFQQTVYPELFLVM